MKRQAVVVGINRYPFWKDLPTSKNGHLKMSHIDAEAVALLLERYGDFQVKRLPRREDISISQLDPGEYTTTEELKKEITDLFNPQIGIPNTALLYFTGRGLLQEYEDNKKESFLATSDTNKRYNYGISLQWLRELLLKSPVKQQIVWLDCGYSGELLNFGENEIVTTDCDRFFITATRNSEPVYTKMNGGGVLTQAIVASLDPTNMDDGKVTSWSMRDIIEAPQLKEEKKRQNTGFYTSKSPIIITGIKGTKWYYQHRLERLWNETTNWFEVDSPEILMKHSSGSISNYFFGDSPSLEKANNYKENIENILELKLPAEWWNNNQSIENLHESLKCLCGATFCGLSGDRPITIGAAYLIALMAYTEVFKDVTKLTQAIDFSKLTNLDAQLFPDQKPDIAKLSAKALYDLFFCLFTACKNGESGFRKIFFNKPGNKFTIEFTRGGNEAKQEGELSLAEDLFQQLKDDHVPTPKITNTKSAILRLWKYMLISNNGFMSPGVIYMERKTLVVASLK
jgi:hypothetical protein